MALEIERPELGEKGGAARRERSMAHEITGGPAVAGLKERVAAYERRLIQEALWFAGGNQRRAAHALGCLPTTLNEKMRRLGLRGQRILSPGGDPREDSPFPSDGMVSHGA
jgi:DNA-binding NtrC family response regulator